MAARADVRFANRLGAAALLGTALLALTARAEAPGEEGYLAADDGARLYYRKLGNAPRAVVLPGRLFALEDFAWLGRDFTLISYDMRNRGRSELLADDSRISFDHDVRDLEAVRRHFGLERMALMGYSYLGKIAVLYALERPERVERIVQLGPVGPDFTTAYRPEFVFRDDPVDPAARAALRARRSEESFHITHPREYCLEEWRVAVRPTLVGDPSRVDRVRSDVCDLPNEWPLLQVRHLRVHFEQSGMGHRTDLDAVRRLQVPVLTVHGTRDRNAPYGAGRLWSYLLPQGRLLTVEGAGHHAFGEFPEIVMPAVRRFLSGDWPDGAVKVAADPRQP